MKLAYAVEGIPGAPLLVLSPSLGTTTSLWAAQEAAFATRFRLVRHDHPGHGHSHEPDGPVSIETIGRSVLEILDELGAERASFCGVSLGGMVGMWLGANAPERIDRLVLASTGAKLGTPETYRERAELVRRKGTAATVEGARERWFTAPFRDEPAAAAVLEELAAVPAEGYAACCDAVGDWDFRSELGRVAAPTLVVAGAEDPTVTPAVCETLVDGIPGARLVVIPDASHIVNVEQPDAFTAEFQELITRYAWGEIWARPGLDRRTRSAITIAMLVALGREHELALHVRAARRNGLSVDELKEVLLQATVYCGVPAGNRAFAIAQRELGEEAG
jgi:3-oxoadipate enol-lactonase/4-carboxymuconolactone decarboxylase